MACMSHVCRKCSWMKFDNDFFDGPCPKCGGEVYSVFDEEFDHGNGNNGE